MQSHFTRDEFVSKNWLHVNANKIIFEMKYLTILFYFFPIEMNITSPSFVLSYLSFSLNPMEL